MSSRSLIILEISSEVLPFLLKGKHAFLQNWKSNAKPWSLVWDEGRGHVGEGQHRQQTISRKQGPWRISCA